jgi:hypothetical protein
MAHRIKRTIEKKTTDAPFVALLLGYLLLFFVRRSVVCGEVRHRCQRQQSFIRSRFMMGSLLVTSRSARSLAPSLT